MDSAVQDKAEAQAALPEWAQGYYDMGYDITQSIIADNLPGSITGFVYDATQAGANSIYKSAKEGISANEAGRNALFDGSIAGIKSIVFPDFSLKDIKKR